MLLSRLAAVVVLVFGAFVRPNTLRIRFGDYALWFARKSYEHMAHAPALPDAVVASGARATAPR